MIPEIEEKFKIINWLREQKVDYDDEFEKMPQREQINLATSNTIINSLIGKLQSEINEIAKEHGNSYRDENGEMTWVKSELKGEKL